LEAEAKTQKNAFKRKKKREKKKFLQELAKDNKKLNKYSNDGSFLEKYSEMKGIEKSKDLEGKEKKGGEKSEKEKMESERGKNDKEKEMKIKEMVDKIKGWKEEERIQNIQSDDEIQAQHHLPTKIKKIQNQITNDQELIQ
jgi:hypothetical protein